MAANSLLGHLESALQALSSTGARSALIGGFAAVLRGCNRLTRDLDFMVLADAGSFSDARKAFEERGFELRGPDEGIILGDITLWRYWKQLESVFVDAPVDLQVGTTPFHHSVVERASVETFQGMELRVATAEDVIILKLIAFRPIDRGDAITIVEASLHPLDWRYLESWCDQLGVRERLEEVRREAQAGSPGDA